MFFFLVVVELFLAYALFCSAREKPLAHIYVDIASTPSLFQMVDLIQRPENEPKYAAWIRFTHPVSKDTLRRINLQKSLIKDGNPNYLNVIKKELSAFYQKYKNYDFTIHLNYHQKWMWDSILNIIPKNQVKNLYFYEDSIGYFLWKGWNASSISYIKNYPTIFCFSHHDVVLKKYPVFRSLHTQQQNIFNQVFHMDDSKKEILYQLSGLDNNILSKLVNGREYVVFLDDPNMNIKSAFSFLDNIMYQNPELRSMHWIYKNHPRGGRFRKTLDVLRSRVSSVIVIPEKIPFELLIIAGLNPKYVFGYSSSTFFSLNQKNILGYMPRPYDPYIGPLIDLGILSNSLIIK